MHSFRLLAPLSTARSVSTTTFSSSVVPARKASSPSSEKDFDIDDDVPLPPVPSSNKTASPAPNPYPETILDVPLTGTDWSRSYTGLSTEPFPKELAEILMGPVDPMDVEIKPDGLLYLPEIKYRRILNKAFGPGGWGLAPRSETNVSSKVVSREYALVCLGRLVAIARGEQDFYDPSGVATATEACKSNALMRCCKDLGIASELWDPRFIREFKSQHCIEVFATNSNTKAKKKLWRRKDSPKFSYPWQES